MAGNESRESPVELLEEAAEFNFRQLCDICQVAPELLAALVDEGVLHANGDRPAHWSFSATAVTRVRRACRLRHDLELDFGGLALALDLMEERDRLQAELGRLRQHLRLLMDSTA